MSTLSLQSRIDQLDEFVVEAVKDVCFTMLDWTVTESTAETGFRFPVSFELGEVNGCVGFGGKWTGTVFLSCQDATARRMARTILGGDAPTAQDVSDVVGELTNMLAGGCASRLCEHNCPVVMSTPNVVRGQAIQAGSRDIKFMLKRDFAVSITGEKLEVIVLGKFE
jgi:CheY-specific phosphatase CheX